MQKNSTGRKLLCALMLAWGGISSSFAQQGFTPFIPPPAVPATGVPYLKDDPAYPKYVQIYDQIQSNFGNASGMESARIAIGELQKAYPKSPYPFFALAEYKYALAGQDYNGNPEATAILDKVMRANGANLPDGYILRAKISADQGYGYPALEDAKIAIRFAPEKPEAQFAMAQAERVIGSYAEAESWYRKFIASEPNPVRKANGYSWLGHMYASANMTRSEHVAVINKIDDAYRMCAEIGPTHSHRYQYAMFLLTSKGDIDKSGKIFSQLVKDYSDTDGAGFYLALIEYLKWARQNPSARNASQLDAIQTRTGLNKEIAFVVSSAYDGLQSITSTMLDLHAVKNVNVSCADNCGELPGPATAMVFAAYNDDLPLVKKLTAQGGNVNAQGFENRTPLMYSLFSRDIGLVGYLLDKGARVNVATHDGLTPLDVAISNSPQSGQLVDLLLKHKADASGVDGSGTPIAAAAISKSNLDAFKALMHDGKVNPNMKDSHGTPLLAYAMVVPEAVKILLANGADPWVSTSAGDLLLFADSYPKQSVALIEEARKKHPRQ
jgi:tetratricopeptide (TPR) repeat protein